MMIDRDGPASVCVERKGSRLLVRTSTVSLSTTHFSPVLYFYGIQERSSPCLHRAYMCVLTVCCCMYVECMKASLHCRPPRREETRENSHSITKTFSKTAVLLTSVLRRFDWKSIEILLRKKFSVQWQGFDSIRIKSSASKFFWFIGIGHITQHHRHGILQYGSRAV